MNRLSVINNRILKASLVNRWPQLIILAIMLAAFLFAILSGFIGTPVGSHNFSIVFIWIAWWGILILIAVPFFGRSWCAVCPIPLPGEWLQRGRVLGPEKINHTSLASSLPSGLGLSASSGHKEHKGVFNNIWRPGNSRWPRALRNIWMQNASFLLVALFSSIILTTPVITSAVLAAMLFFAVGLSMVFQRRAFCRYLCPVGGFIGLYAQAAPVELRIQNKAVCGTCQGKPCYNGSSAGYGCPWDVFPGGLTKNTYCGLCLECLRTCPHDNIAINARPFAADLSQPLTRLDEAYKAFIMLGSAMIYAGVLLGPWGALKNIAYNIFTPAWFAYAFAFLGVILVALPGLFTGALSLTSSPSADGRGMRASFTAFSTALIPLGLMFWVAFSLSFVLTNASYILISLSDPFGWGWDLFGTAGFEWQPIAASLVAPVQTLVLVGSLLWSTRLAHRIASERKVSAIPVSIFCLAVTLVMLWLLL